MQIKDIKDGIVSIVEDTLGAGWNSLSFVSDVSLNKWNRQYKRFGVLPSSAVVVDGTVGMNTLDHTFNLILTDGYLSGAQSQVTDELKIDRIHELQDNALLLYKQIQLQKNTLGAGILVVNGLDLNEAEFLEEEKVIVLRFSINVKYKIQ